MEQEWWTVPVTGDGGGRVMVTCRDEMDKVRESGKYPYLVRVSWRYNSLPDGFPDERDEELMGRVHDALVATFDKDRTAWLVAVFTGDGRRDWLFYAHNLAIFGKVFNRALEEIETVPLEIDAQMDAEWETYGEVLGYRIEA